MKKVLEIIKEHYIAICVLVVFVAFDYVSKMIVEKSIHYGQRIDIIGSFVQFTKMYNEGGVFGILQGHKNVFLIISIFVFFIMVSFYVLEKNKTVAFKIAMGLIFSGAIGNILDRLAQKPGVVDFIYVGFGNVRWPAFNVADSAIIAGAFLLLYVFFIQRKENK